MICLAKGLDYGRGCAAGTAALTSFRAGLAGFAREGRLRRVPEPQSGEAIPAA